MPLYRYVKRYPRRRRKLPVALPFILMGGGLLLLVWVAWPIVSFRFIAQDFLVHTVTPIPDETRGTLSPISQVVYAAGNNTKQALDYSNPNVWFPGRTQKKVVTPVTSYTLSIPKLKIKNATVMIAGDDLNDSLIHYGGTALPGEYGNTVIFGHSTLPQLYNPENYHTIFTHLPSLKAAKDGQPGDYIYVTYNGVTYTYEVFEMHVTKPTDASPLEQQYDGSYLTLVTCVPPGTYWERLNVKAKLVPL